MAGSKVAKVTISLPQKVLQAVDRLANERATTRSSIIVRLVEKEEEARIEALMEEGYKEMAEENLRLVKEFFPLESDAVLKNTKWDETNGQTG